MKKHLWKAISLYPILTFAAPGSPASESSAKLGRFSNLVTLNHANNSFNDTLAITSSQKFEVIPEIKLQRTIASFVKDYIKKNDFILDEIKEKNNSSFNTIEKVFEKQGLPIELKYLAVIESELKTSATSRVGAVGIWQLMPHTGRLLGLKIKGKTDERKYIYKSTVAAAKYLNDLYTEFDDWLLVIAAYNAGPGTVYKAIKKSGSRDFWKLQYFLPKETRLHVKRFIATHWYYEDRGSIVTLTKAEREKHLKAVKEFEAIENETNDSPIETENFFNCVIISQDNSNKLKFVPKI